MRYPTQPFARSLSPFSRPALGHHQVLFFEPDNGNNPPANSGNQDAALQALLQRHNNDAMALVTSLYAENSALRGRVPAEGSLVLSAADATAWQGFQQLGALNDVQQRLTEAQAATSELAGLKRDKLISDVAGIGGEKPFKPGVLARLAGESLQFEIRGEGDKRSVVVKDGDKETPLAEYAKTNWSDFLPSLYAEAAPAGTSFVRQPSGAPAPQDAATEAIKGFQATRDSKPNPLKPSQS